MIVYTPRTPIHVAQTLQIEPAIGRDIKRGMQSINEGF